MKKSYKKILLLLFVFQFVIGTGDLSAKGWFKRVVQEVAQAVSTAATTIFHVATNYCGTWSPNTKVKVNGVQGGITVCKGSLITLSVDGDIIINNINSGLSDKFTWIIGNGSSVGTGRSLTITANVTTTYFCYGKKAFIFNDCPSTLLGQVTVTVIDPSSSLMASTILKISSGSTISTNFGKNNTTFHWSRPFFNSGSLSGISPSGFGPSNGSPSHFSQTIVNNTNVTQLAIYTLTPIISGCTGTSFNVWVVVYPIPRIFNRSISVCSGSAFAYKPLNGDNSITTIVPVGTTYLWGPPTVTGGITGGSLTTEPLTSINQTLINPTNTVQTATYNVITFSPMGYEGSSFILTVYVAPAAPSVIINPVTICKGESAILTANGGATRYVWSTGANTNPIIVNPTTTTTYSVTGTTPNSCATHRSVTVTVLSIHAGSNQTICQGSEVILQGSGATNYSWYPGTGLNNTVIANPVASPQVTTTYSVLSSCGNVLLTDAVKVTVNPNPNLTLANSTYVICQGQNVVLSAIGSGTFNWQPTTGLDNSTASSPTASPSVSTDYKVTLTDNTTGCSSSANVDVLVNSISVIPDQAVFTIEKGDKAQFNVEITGGGNNGVNLSWLPTGSLNNSQIKSPLANPIVTTTYTVFAQAGGCIAQATIVVNVLEKPNAVFDYKLSCGDLNVQFTTNNSGTFTYLWNFGDGTTSTDPSPQHMYSTEGNYNVCLKVNSQLSEANYCYKVYVQSAP